MNTRATALLLCFFILNAMVTFNSGVSAVPSQMKGKQNTFAASENNMEQQTPRSVISSAADAMNRRDFDYYSTTSFYGYPDGKRGFFECRPAGNRCSFLQRCCGALRCDREKFFHFFGRCY